MATCEVEASDATEATEAIPTYDAPLQLAGSSCPTANQPGGTTIAFGTRETKTSQ